MDDYDFDDSIMLPPTTSTYNPHVEPCTPEPDVEVLRRRLRDALSQTKNAWARAGEIPQEGEDCEDLQHLQGTELCNLGTAAVRAAKTYYCVTDISLLSTKDARTMREEFMAVLGVLRHMVQRKFSGGIEAEEHTAMISWVTCIEEALFEEEAAVAEIRQKGRDWLEGSWDGREYGMLQIYTAYLVCQTSIGSVG